MTEIILGKGEKPIREENNVWYHGGAVRFGTVMKGKLVLTTKRLTFTEIEKVWVGGIMGLGAKQEERVAGIRINIPVDKIAQATTSALTRKPGTLREAPTLFAKETISLLVLGMETETGVDNAKFEVQDANGWANALNSLGAETL